MLIFSFLKKTDCLTLSVWNTIFYLLRRIPINEPRQKLREIVSYYGYNLQEHQVQTPDGYILSVHRVSQEESSESAQKQRNRPVIFLQHGLMCSSAEWLVKKGLAYSLVNLDYDVWLGNFRGNAYSSSHEVYTPDDPEYWHFSWDHHGQKDLPTMIDYVLEETKQKKLGKKLKLILNLMKSLLSDEWINLNFVLVSLCFENITEAFRGALSKKDPEAALTSKRKKTNAKS